jgi:alpha-glucosidase
LNVFDLASMEEAMVEISAEESMTELLWWKTGVIYQIYPRSFKDTTGNGIGDLSGVIEKLDYLSDTLGVDAIWLSPFYPSPMADFGYDVANYVDVHPLFGDLRTFDELVLQAHRRDLNVIIDLVPNHTSDQHPWFVESRASRASPKRDWYVWRDARPDGSLPNNWLSVFGGPAWEWDQATRQYYLHSFLKEQPDLNWRNPQVKKAMFEVARFWLERGIDGFRIDVAHFIMKDPDLRDNPPNPGQEAQMHKSLGVYDSQIHLYDKGHADVHRVYREFRQLLDEYSRDQPRVSIGEIHIFDWPAWASYYGKNLDEIHMPFNFTLLGVKWQARVVRSLVDRLEAVLPPGAWPNYVLSNHDEPRLASHLGKEAARMAAMLLLTLRGTPTLYYGDEIGMMDVPIPVEKEQDPWGKRVPGLGRDPQRTPMQWTAGPSAGFSAADPQALWLLLSPEYQATNVAVELNDPGSILNLYRSLLAYRRSHLSLQAGDYQPLDGMPESVFAYLRRAHGFPGVLVLMNFAAQAVQVQLPGRWSGRLALSTYLDCEGEVDLQGLTLRAYEGWLIELD